MKPGPKTAPTTLKLVNGNPGKRSLPNKEPKPQTARPDAPAFLGDEAKLEWARIVNRLADVGLMTDLDVGVLAAYCDAYGRWEQASKAMATLAAKDKTTHGLVIKTSNGNLIQNPLVGTINVAMQLMHKFAVEFGMTPSARTSLDVDVGHAGQAAPQGSPNTPDRFFA